MGAGGYMIPVLLVNVALKNEHCRIDIGGSFWLGG